MTNSESAKRRRAASAALVEGDSVQEVAEAFGYAISTVKQLASSIRRPKGQVQASTSVDIIAALLKSKGRCGAEIARRLSVSRQRVSYVKVLCIKAGIEFSRYQRMEVCRCSLDSQSDL